MKPYMRITPIQIHSKRFAQKIRKAARCLSSDLWPPSYTNWRRNSMIPKRLSQHKARLVSRSHVRFWVLLSLATPDLDSFVKRADRGGLISANVSTSTNAEEEDAMVGESATSLWSPDAWKGSSFQCSLAESLFRISWLMRRRIE